MRNDFTQLPDHEELMKIINSESGRLAKREFLDEHHVDYGAIVKLFEALDLYNIFEEQFNLLEYTKTYQRFKHELIQKLLVTNVDQVILDQIYDYLSEEDALTRSDAIFVFGSENLFRIQKAVQIYRDGWSRKLIISGDKPFYKQNNINEASSYKDYALQAGVDEKSILVEPKGLTIPDNVKRTVDLFLQIDLKPESLIIVTAPFAQRRCWLDWQKFCPWPVRLVRQNSEVGEDFSKENWFKNEHGAHVVLNEFFKFRGEHLIDLELAEIKS